MKQRTLFAAVVALGVTAAHADTIEDHLRALRGEGFSGQHDDTALVVMPIEPVYVPTLCDQMLRHGVVTDHEVYQNCKQAEIDQAGRFVALRMLRLQDDDGGILNTPVD